MIPNITAVYVYSDSSIMRKQFAIPVFSFSLVFILIYSALEFTRGEAASHDVPVSRGKRAVTYSIDVMPVIDYALYKRFLTRNKEKTAATDTAVDHYIKQIFASVQLRFDRTSDLQLQIKLVNPFVAKTALASEFSESIRKTDTDGRMSVNATELLSSFEKWLKTKTTDLPSFDHAMLFTGFNIYGTSDSGNQFNFTKGLAYVGTLCRGDQSVSVIEDRGAYQSEGVVVHELGHVLGAVHDGVGNECMSTSRYIMSDNFNYGEAKDTEGNPWKFSPCSVKAIHDNIRKLEQDSNLKSCLDETTGQTLPAANLTIHPNQVCQDFYGTQSFTCRGVGIAGIKAVCRSLFCRQPGTNSCVLLSAPTGTCCGYRKSCRLGICDSVIDQSTCEMDLECPFGDQTGVVIGEKTCQQIDANMCYSEHIREKCCLKCRKLKVNVDDCEYGDKIPDGRCDKKFCGTEITFNKLHYNSVCCHTCQNVKCTDTTTLNNEDKPPKQYACVDFFATYGRAYCYKADVLSACCAACEQVRDNAKPDCPFGDNIVEKKCPMLLNVRRDCSEDENRICCETCLKKQELKITTQVVRSNPRPGVPTESTKCSNALCSGRGLKANVLSVVTASAASVQLLKLWLV